MSLYPPEVLGEEEDDGTMPDNVAALTDAIIGQRIVSVDKETHGMSLTLSSGRRVKLLNSQDCCAYTGLEAFLLHPEMIDHIITGVGTTDGYSTWHIYADLGDILELTVEWSCGNPFYYAYGFEIRVEDISS